MNGTVLDVLRTIAASSGLAAFFAFLGYSVQSLVKRREAEIGGDAGLRRDMAAMIDGLRQEAKLNDERCKNEIARLWGWVQRFGRVLIAVSYEAEKADPNSISVAAARKLLDEAFPLDAPNDPRMDHLINELKKHDKHGGGR